MRDRRPLLGRNEISRLSPNTEDKNRKKINNENSEPSKHVTLKELLGRILFFIILLGVPLFFVYNYTPFFVFEKLRCRAIDKLWGDNIVREMEEDYTRFAASPPRFPSLEYNKTMMWGTYEPGLLFAMKTRTPKPVYIGIAWYDEAGLHPVRHKMSDLLSIKRRKEVSDGVISDEKSTGFEISWALHDGVHYGRQLVQDGPSKINIEFLKSSSGDSWHVRVHFHMDGAKPLIFVVYVINDNGEAIIPEIKSETDNSLGPQIKSEFEDADGRREGFMLLVRDDYNSFFANPPWQVYGLHNNEGEFLRDVDLRNLPSNAHIYSDGSSNIDKWKIPPSGSLSNNVMVFRKKYDSDFRVELSMRHASNIISTGEDATTHQSFVANYDALTACQLTNSFRLREKDILYRMRQAVKPWASGFRINSKLYINRARRLLSGAMGTWGFWYGKYLYVNPDIDKLWDDKGISVSVKSDEQLRTGLREVSAFGATNSRVDSAHGDLTLTGLQLLFILDWNKEWAKEAIASWIVDSQDLTSGFIPTRAVFSLVTRASALPNARYEHLTFATPPTILLTLQQLLKDDKKMGMEKDYFKLLLEPLRRWRSWFHLTQSTSNNTVSLEDILASKTNENDKKKYDPPRYRWRSRDDYRIFASGMTDYPRPICTGYHKQEAHVDLFSWIALLSNIISEIELYLGLSETVPKQIWLEWLEAVHWDAKHQRYADRTGCPDDSFSPYIGYTNLYPFLLGIIEDKERAEVVLELARRKLITSYGVMSVSYDSVREAREAGLRHDNLWMGHVWVSTNILVLHALRTKYINLIGESAKELFKHLRLSMVETAGRSPTMQEFFNPVTGSPEGTASFVGQRALLLALLKNYN